MGMIFRPQTQVTSIFAKELTRVHENDECPNPNDQKARATADQTWYLGRSRNVPYVNCVHFVIRLSSFLIPCNQP